MSEQTSSNVVYLRPPQEEDISVTEEQLRLENLYFQAFERLTHLREVVDRLKDETNHLQDCVHRLADDPPARE